MADVTSVALSDVVVRLQRGKSYSGALVGQPGPVLLGLGTIERNGGFRAENARTYGGDSPVEILARSGDLYVSLKDVTHAADLLGAVARVPRGVPFGRLTQDTIRVDIDTNVIDADYLYWALRDPGYRRYCRSLGTGTTNLDLSRRDFLAYQLRLPPLNEQRAIAEVLGALDDKIAANDRVAETADELVRAKYNRIAARSEIRIRIGAIAENVRIQAKPAEFDATTPYIGLEHVPRRLMWTSGAGSAEGLGSAKFRFLPGDVLFGKLRPYFHKVVRADEQGVCSTDILVVRAKESNLQGFVLAAVASDEVVRECVAASEGTRMPRTSWKDLAAVKVAWPGDDAAREFSSGIDAIAESVGNAMRQNGLLAELRDTLLPELMSGRLTVREAETTVSEAI